jgi:hypothetical protein
MLHRPISTRLSRVGASEVVVFACAATAGIHAGIVPEHLHEEPRLGFAFIIAVLLLVGTAAAIVLRPLDRRAQRVAALLLGGLAVAYAGSRTTGIPLLAPESEAVDAVGLAAVAVELVGAAFALSLGQPIGRRVGGLSFRR